MSQASANPLAVCLSFGFFVPTVENGHGALNCTELRPENLALPLVGSDLRLLRRNFEASTSIAMASDVIRFRVAYCSGLGVPRFGGLHLVEVRMPMNL